MTIKVKMARNNERDAGNEETRIQVFVQQMLRTRLFIATYTGRNYVQPLKDYRDVLKIHEEENDLIRDLEIVKKRINDFYRGAMWASITGAGDMETEALTGMCIWTKLENVAFGSYWFMIQNVSFSDLGELIINLKVVRKYEPEAETTPTIFDGSINWDEMKENILLNLNKFGACVIKSTAAVLTWHNMKESSKFIFLLLMTLGTGLMYVLQYLGDYSIKFFREFNNFIKVMTPIFLAVIEMLTKTVGGFYLLVVMLWRGHNQPAMPVSQFPSLMASSQQKFKPGYQKKFPPGYRNEHYF